MKGHVVRKVAFWGGVAGVSVLANFGLELAATKWPQLGLSRFTAFTHKGAS
jgi:hypothetical protein